MKNILLFTVALAILAACQSNNQLSDNEQVGNVYVQIKYSDSLMITDSTAWYDGITALTALQSVAEVKTHPVGQYVFVTAIDSVAGQRGIKAWYYKVNGKSPGKLPETKNIPKC